MWLHTALALTVAQWSEHSPRLSSGLAPRFPQAFVHVSVVPDLVNSLTGSQYWGGGVGVRAEEEWRAGSKSLLLMLQSPGGEGSGRNTLPAFCWLLPAPRWHHTCGLRVKALPTQFLS